MKLNCRRLLTSLAAFLVLGVGSAHAQSLSINNHGFEADIVANGTFPVLVPSGWSVYDPNNLIDGAVDAIGLLNPTGTTFFPGGAPEGNNVAIAYISGDIGGGLVGLSQVLTDTLQANTVYSLNVDVGNIASGTGLPPFDQYGFFNLTGFPGYRIQLLAGGVVLAEDNNSLASSLGDGQFALSSIQFTTGNSHEQLGQALEIRLLSRNEAESVNNPGIEVDFDNVRLSATSLSAPEPGALTLIGVAISMIGMVRWGRRREV